MTVDLDALAAPTPANEIKTRKGPSGMTLDYVDARFVMERLDASVGPENWQDKYEEHQGGSVRCSIGIRIADVNDWVWKSDVGDPSDIESTKGAHSDAFKRAAVKWGVARDLYGDHAKPQNGPRRPQTAPDAPQRESVVMTAAKPVLVAVGGPAGEPDLDFDFAGLIDGGSNGKAEDPTCRMHERNGKAMAKNRRQWYCPNKLEDGSWCPTKFAL